MKIERHFGPPILQTQAPIELVNRLNSWVDDMQPAEHEIASSKGDNPIPDLLNRGFETLFLTYEKCDEIGFTEFVLSLAKEFNATAVLPSASFGGVPYEQHADVWVNRYYEGHQTPPHRHSYDLSGIIMLKIPDKSPKLEFMYGPEIYQPEQIVGKTLLFPSHTDHQVHTQCTKEERRTLSFNLQCKW